jgi:large subunit ribosomal protein L21e
VDIDSREHKSTPHRRFQGKIGVVREVGKRSLKITVMFGKKQKILQTRLNHTKLFIT